MGYLSGVAEVTGKSDVEGVSCFVVKITSDTTPTREWELYVEEAYGLPLRWIEREVYPEQYRSMGWEGDARITALRVRTYPFYQAARFKSGDIHVRISGDISYRGLLEACEEMLAGSD